MTSERVEAGLLDLQRATEGPLEIISLQELARDEQGWGCHQMGRWTVYSYRDSDEWRSSGIGFRSDLWTLMRKRQSGKGLWVRLRRIFDGAEVWCGSTYFSQGATREVHASEVHAFMDAFPVTTLPILLGGDMNTPVRWAHGAGDITEASGPESKGDYMIGVFKSKGIRLTPPAETQWSVPTSKPRRADASGRQIDMLGCKWSQAEDAHIHVDSHLFMGTTDHDAVTQRVVFRLKPRVRFARGSNKAREVCRVPVVRGDLNQEELERLAKECTRPRAGAAYRDPQDVKVLFQMARAGKRSEDWKRALRARLEARKAWTNQKIAAAAQGDWGAFQVATKKGRSGWEGHLADALGEGQDPHQQIHNHLQGVYGAKQDKVPPYPGNQEVAPCADFTAEELRDALRKGRRKVSVGPDRVSHELLQAIGNTAEGEAKILAWFNRLLHGQEPIPKRWSRASMVLLPKVSQPTEVKQVRPICIGASASKLFARMLMVRTQEALKYVGSAQCMGEGRQSADRL